MCGALKIISVSICHPIKPTAAKYARQPAIESTI